MGFKNADLDRELAYRFKPVTAFHLGWAEGTGAALGVRESANGGATVLLGELSTTGIIGMIVHANGDQISDIAYPFPEFDVAMPMYLQVLFSTTSADLDAVTFKFHYAPLVANAVIPAVTGTTVSFTASAAVGQYKLVTTAAATIAAATFTKNTLYHMALECDAWAGSADECYVLGLIGYGYLNATGQSGL